MQKRLPCRFKQVLIWKKEYFLSVGRRVRLTHKLGMLDIMMTTLVSVEIYLLDKQDQRRYGVKLWDAFPKSINGSDLSYGSNNENLKITVNMSFRYWTPLDINESGPNIGNKIIDTIANGVERQILSNIPKVFGDYRG